MRDIKFRAWENIEKRMETNVQNGVYDDPDEYIDFGRILGYARFDVMQYTGLNDKNGVEIYEGDILLFVNEDGDKSYYEVIFEQATWKMKCPGYDADDIYGDEDTVEVVGNIYENPELVTEVN